MPASGNRIAVGIVTALAGLAATVYPGFFTLLIVEFGPEAAASACDAEAAFWPTVVTGISAALAGLSASGFGVTYARGKPVGHLVTIALGIAATLTLLWSAIGGGGLVACAIGT